MKILVINETSTSRALGYYMVLFRLNRRYYYAAISASDNSVMSIESEYKNEKGRICCPRHNRLTSNIHSLKANTMKTNNTPTNLKGMAKHTYNRVMSAMAEDTTSAMLHTFAALTDGAKDIVLQSGKYSNLYIRGERKDMAAEEAAKELTERAAAGVTRKLRKIDMVCAASFLAEYITRQRNEIETPEAPSPDNTPTNLKGMAKHTYNRVMSAMAEDTTSAMLHTFAALTDGAKDIVLQSGKYSNLYIRGERKDMAAEEAAKELTERAAAGVTRKLRKIDMVCAASFLAEYITRQRNEIETPEAPSPDNTPTTMNAKETTEFSELTHAGQCLDIYLHNTAQIYERYTVPAIERVTRAIKAGEYVSDNAGQLAKDIQEITPAMQAAARLVKRYDHLTPTAKDIEQVTRNYAAYIVDCAKYEIEQ